jgi:hypothetical protein
MEKNIFFLGISESALDHFTIWKIYVRQVGGRGGGSRKNSRRKKYKGKKGRNGRKSVTRGGPKIDFFTSSWFLDSPLKKSHFIKKKVILSQKSKKSQT